MEDLDDEYKNYWETTMFFQNQELEFDSWALEEAFSSPDGAATSPASSKNVVSERNRRQKLNQRLFALRSVVPNISKLDKASVIKDSIAYMQQLIDQEKRLEAEIKELESSRSTLLDNLGFAGEHPSNKIDYNFRGSSAPQSSIEVLEMKVTWMGEKTVVVCITCRKKRETMLELCKVLESLNLNILTANFSSFSSRLSTTLFLQVDEEESSEVEANIQTAIAAYNDPNCLINF